MSKKAGSKKNQDPVSQVQALDLKGKILFLSGAEINPQVLSAINEKVKIVGGLGVIYLPGTTVVTWDSIHKAIEEIQLIVNGKVLTENAEAKAQKEQAEAQEVSGPVMDSQEQSPTQLKSVQ